MGREEWDGAEEVEDMVGVGESLVTIGVNTLVVEGVMVEVERVEVGVSVFVVAGLVWVSGFGEVGMRGVCFVCGASETVVEVMLSRGSRAWSLVSVEVRREPAVCVLPAELFAWRDMLDVILFSNPFLSFSRSGRP